MLKQIDPETHGNNHVSRQMPITGRKGVGRSKNKAYRRPIVSRADRLFYIFFSFSVSFRLTTNKTVGRAIADLIHVST